MNIEMIKIKTVASLVILAALMIVAASAADSKENTAMKCDLFNAEEILDESTLDVKILEDWHLDEPTSSTRQKLIEINVAEWWPGQDYRIPVRMIVPLEGKAKGFHITGAADERYETRRLSGKTAGQWSWNCQDVCQADRKDPGKKGPGTKGGEIVYGRP
ncbi:MAG: hypothetical protein ACYSUB_21200 [Planctomycetota bacterium]|jgi:hypothetical protein